MSAEKEVVNFWLNRKGYFTISNLKSGNKDIGLLALKFDDGELKQIMHLEVNCSITGFSDQNFINKIISEKFEDKNIANAIRKYAKNMGKKNNIENALVLNSLPKDKEVMMEKLSKKNINVFQFEDILADVMKNLGTSYFKDDVVRTLQIMKFLLLSSPKKLVDMAYENLSPAKRREFIAELLDKEDIIKEFKKTNEERLAIILKQAMIKPENLAKMLENDVLNRKTRKPFIESLIEQKKIGKMYKKEMDVKKETPLIKFFG